ncbi:hypothetical protein [Paenibacillus sp. MBLB4367]|uniref:hypothetical protein n=1 Tax=Paenibacillus sp. MBLB4367 TaxID=3384767 RepID=UPI003908448B
MKTGYDKESVYDERIAPLMHEILQICKAEEIPMMATFYLKSEDVTPSDEGNMNCTSWIQPKDNTPEHYPKMCSLARHGEKPYVMAVTVTKGAES